MAVEAVVKPRRIGGSLGVTIPRSIVEELGIRPNRPIAVTFGTWPKKDYFGALKGIGPWDDVHEGDSRD